MGPWQNRHVPSIDQLPEPIIEVDLDTVDETSGALTDSDLGPSPDADLDTTSSDQTKADVLEHTDSNLEADIEAAEKKGKAFRAKLASYKEKLRARPALYHAYRIALATLGGLILLGGVIMLAMPGPGWLTIFLGLGILASEFSWAHRLNVWAKAKARNIVASTKEKVARRRAKKEGSVEPESSEQESLESQSCEQESPNP